MLLIIGALVVLGSIVGGYLMEGGNLLLLNQPAEFVIIGGAALGSLLISTPDAGAETARGAEPRRPRQRPQER